jgi:hypothetical protein
VSASDIILPVKQLNEIVQLPPGGADFTSRLQQGETLTGAPTVTVTVYSGNDPNPSAMLSGVASISGNFVLQNFQGGISGNIYKIIYGCATSLGQFLELFGYLVVLVESSTPPSASGIFLLPGGGEMQLPGGGTVSP